MQPFSQRIRVVFDALQTSPHRFANAYGLNRSSIFNTLSEERRPSFDLVERICAVEPRISAEYLLRGEGEPLRDHLRTTNLTTIEQLMVFKSEINQSLDKRIQELSS